MFLMRSYYTSHEIQTSSQRFQTIEVEVALWNQQKHILSYFYRQPDHKTSQLEEYENSPVEKSRNPCHISTMAGDFSICDIAQGKEHHQKVIKQEHVYSLFPEIMACHLLTQIVHKTTRECSILDVSVTNKPGSVKSVQVILGPGDHECDIMDSTLNSFYSKWAPWKIHIFFKAIWNKNNVDRSRFYNCYFENLKDCDIV